MASVRPAQLMRRLYSHFPARRRRQLVLLLCLMLAGAVAEFASLGAVLPFLSVMTDPDKAAEYHELYRSLSYLGAPQVHDPLWVVMIIFIGVTALAAAIRTLLAWASARFTFMLTYDLSADVFRRTLRQPYLFFVSHHTSEIIAGINNVQQLAGTVLMPAMQLVIAAVTTLFILAALLFINAPAALIAGGGLVGIYVLVSAAMRRGLLRYGGVVARAQAGRIQSVQEGMGGIRNVILDGTHEVYYRRFCSIEGPLQDALATTSFIGLYPRFVVEAAGMALIAALAFWMSRQQGGVSSAIPVLGALALGAQKLLPLVHLAYNCWTTLMARSEVMRDVLKLLEMHVPDARADAQQRPLDFDQYIRLDHVWFRYDDDGPWVLNDLNLLIPKGSRCGIIGRSGGGKSTMLDVVMGLLEPSKGRIMIDGVPVTAITRKSWQSHIAHVPQTIYLSPGSIAENIAFGIDRAQIDAERLHHAARQAQIHDFIMNLPQGYESVVGEHGIRLSGGQRQRIAIARALYTRAEVLILDEATSALDDLTEQAVIECIEGLDRSLTILIIAHRLSTVAMCDMLIRLENGRIVAEGSYEEVVPASTSPA